MKADSSVTVQIKAVVHPKCVGVLAAIGTWFIGIGARLCKFRVDYFIVQSDGAGREIAEKQVTADSVSPSVAIKTEVVPAEEGEVD